MPNDRDGQAIRALQDAATTAAVAYRNAAPRERREMREAVRDAFAAVERARLRLLDEGDDATDADVAEARAIGAAIAKARRTGDIVYNVRRLAAFAVRFL